VTAIKATAPVPVAVGKHDAILSWRLACLRRRGFFDLSPETLAQSMTVENLHWPRDPFKAAAVTAFRHLTQEARVAACRRVT
jgi:hypothetical protein